MQIRAIFGSVTVTPASPFRIEGETTVCQRGTAAIADVTCETNARSIGINIQAIPQSGVEVFVIINNQVPQKLGEAPYLLLVPITWEERMAGGRKVRVPKTRAKGQDNIDVIFMRHDGEFVNVQCGVITRGGKFYMTAQRVFQGQAVRTREQGKLVQDAIPTAAIHAYPGASFTEIWDTMSKAVLNRAQELGATERKSRVTRFAAEWKPPVVPVQPENGWKVGLVHYFNLITGTGQIQDQDGVTHFVHFTNVQKAPDDIIPMLTPMSGVFFQPDADSVHVRPGILAVKSVKPIPQSEAA